jgi:reactive intermediate/imine deaminase
MTKFLKSILTQRAPAPIGPYSQALRSEGLVFISGQTASIPQTIDFNNSSIESQAIQVLDNLKAITEAAGGSLQNVVKLNVYLTDIYHLSIFNNVMQGYFVEPYPCRTTLVVKELENHVDIEVDGIMALPTHFSLQDLAIT